MIQSSTLLEAIERLRPVYLRDRCSRDLDRRVTVMVDGLIAGGVEISRQLRVDGIRGVEHLCWTDAVQRFGTRMQGSVILITTGRWT